jgi:hypothetical protein
VKVDRRLAGIYRFHLQDFDPASCWYLAWLIIRPWRLRHYITSKYLLNFSPNYEVLQREL